MTHAINFFLMIYCLQAEHTERNEATRRQRSAKMCVNGMRGDGCPGMSGSDGGCGRKRRVEKVGVRERRSNTI